MKRSVTSLLGTALMFFAASTARADFVGWDFSWAPNSLVVPADSGGTGGISLTLQNQSHADGSSDVVATNLRTFSSAPRTNPDSVAKGTYSLTMTLTDSASKATGTVTFDGYFSGTFSTTSSNLQNTFSGKTTASLTLGGHKYTITIGPYAPPGPPSAPNAGTISAHVQVDESGGGGGDTPEPSTLVLSCLGLSCLGAASWRKLRNKKAE